jgi:archaeal preflagellin peptidase FlaK
VSGLETLRLLIGAGFLGYAAVLDLRTRRVPNNVWLALGSLALLLFLYDFFGSGRFSWITVLIALGAIAVMYGLWYIHVLAGGADAKAMMALALLVPHAILWTVGNHALPLWPSPMPGVLVVLANSVLVFAVAPLVLAAYNLVRRDLHLPSMFLGYRLPLAKARESWVWVVDHIDAEGRRRNTLFPSAMSDEDYEANLDRLSAAGIERVWVTPKIPFMVPLLIGFVGAFTIGDVLFRLVAGLVARFQ